MTSSDWFKNALTKFGIAFGIGVVGATISQAVIITELRAMSRELGALQEKTENLSTALGENPARIVEASRSIIEQQSQNLNLLEQMRNTTQDYAEVSRRLAHIEQTLSAIENELNLKSGN